MSRRRMEMMITVLSVFTVGISARHIEYSPIVQTSTGQVRGSTEYTLWLNKPYYSFKGIPYAEPPVGQFRFRPTIPKEPWSGIWDATQEGDVCAQMDFVFGNFTGSEDCLYLNVYSPVKDFDVPKATMVWIYGGSFYAGYKDSRYYGGDLFLNDDVVLVTLNYRLGAYGFIAIEDTPVSGNMALKDQLLALEWVKKNIRNFGGDPENITLFGQSAGGVAVDCHIISPRSKGLFTRTISQSATIITPWAFASREKSHERAKALGSRLNCNTNNGAELLKCLLNADPRDVVEQTDHLTIADRPFKPTLETENDFEPFLTTCAIEAYSTGAFQKLPHMMGYVKDEAVLFSKIFGDLQESIDNLLGVFNSIGGNVLFQTIGLDRHIFNFNSAIHNGSNELNLGIINKATDLAFISEIDMKQKILAQYQSEDIYYYRITYETDQALHKVQFDIDIDGVAHGDDFGYLFYASLFNEISVEQDSPFSNFRRRMVRLWTNFAKYQNPTPDDDELLNVTWPSSNSNGLQLNIGPVFKVEERYTDALLTVIEPLIKANLRGLSGCPGHSTLISLLEVK